MSNIAIFKDTLSMCKTNSTLTSSIEQTISRTKLYNADDYPDLGEPKFDDCKLIVTPQRTFEAAFSLAEEYPDARIGVLNFANSINPGGGVKLGANAQEECLCRCSTLYPCISTPEMVKEYYRKNLQKMNPLATDACIYTPDIVVFKSDKKEPKLLAESKWIKADVLTCAAPNLSVMKISHKKQFDIHRKRGSHILSIAAANGIDVLVLGAFGCGAFMNHTETVAEAYMELMEQYKGYFREIRFAVVSSENHPSANFNVFFKYLNR